jgi:conjugal transfer pilus assembly protein TraB
MFGKNGNSWRDLFGSKKPSVDKREPIISSDDPGIVVDGKSTSRPTRAAASQFGSLNESVARKQRIIFASGTAAILVLGSWYILSPTEKDIEESSTEKHVSVTSSDLANTNLSQKEWVAMSERRLLTTEQNSKMMKDQLAQLPVLEQKIAELQLEKQAITTNGQQTFEQYEKLLASQSAEINKLKSQGVSPQKAPVAQVGPGGVPAGLYGPGQPGVDPASLPPPSQVKLIAFEGGGNGATGKGGIQYGRPEVSPVVVEDSPDYLPPNAVAPATVVVGVDASTGVQSQTDPLPILLRITGPARSVFANGRLLTTRLEGCLVNGAARGELSSEKVYVKLQKLTCQQPGGRIAVSEVKGYIAFAGKAGVRGQVVSREGSLTTQAFMAGIVGGIGRGFQANSSSTLQGVSVSTGGKRDKLSLGEIASGGIGEGVSQAGDMVSKYLIERAEQYQPVIEMPTGLDVEIVFLDGVYVRAPGN